MDYCGECTYLVPDKCKGYSNGYFYCEKKDTYVLASTEHCYDYCRAYSRPDYIARELQNRSVREKNGYDSSSCYITTIVSNILGYKDNGYVLNILRNFRNNYLQENNIYKSLLVEYDIIGPLIAKDIYNSPNKEEIAFNLYEHILKNIVIEIEQGNYENAIKLYKGMTYGLKVCFGYANKNIDPAIISSKDIKESGHGKVLKK